MWIDYLYSIARYGSSHNLKAGTITTAEDAVSRTLRGTQWLQKPISCEVVISLFEHSCKKFVRIYSVSFYNGQSIEIHVCYILVYCQTFGAP